MHILLASIVLIAFTADTELDKLAKGLKAKDAKSRLKTVVAIEALGEKAEPISRELCDAILDKDARVGKAALGAIEKVSPKLYKPLCDMLLNRPEEQTIGVQRLIKLKEEAKPALGIIANRYRRSVELNERLYLLFGMETINPDDEVTVQSFKKAVLSRGDAERNEGLRFLDKWAGDKADRRKDIYLLVKTDFSKKPSPQNIEMIGKSGVTAKAILPKLKNLKLSDDRKVREAAAEAIEKIEAALKP